MGNPAGTDRLSPTWEPYPISRGRACHGITGYSAGQGYMAGSFSGTTPPLLAVLPLPLHALTASEKIYMHSYTKTEPSLTCSSSRTPPIRHPSALLSWTSLTTTTTYSSISLEFMETLPAPPRGSRRVLCRVCGCVQAMRDG